MSVPENVYEAAKAYFECGEGKLFVHPKNPEGEYYFCSLTGGLVETAIFHEGGELMYSEQGQVRDLTVVVNARSESPAVGHVFK